MFAKAETGGGLQVGDGTLLAGREVVHAEDVVTGLQQARGQMEPDEPGTAGDEDVHR